MAIITEEDQSPKTLHRNFKQELKPEPDSRPFKSRNPFHFWFYINLFISLITLFCIILSFLTFQDPNSWFHNLPQNLRQYYSSGRMIKVQTAPNRPQVEVFSLQQGPVSADSHVLIVHGMGCSSFAFDSVVKLLGLKSIHAIAIDLPGTGFSDRSIVVVEEHLGGNGIFGRMWGVYEEIKEKGLFWGFDQLVEQGYVNFEENKMRISEKESIRAIELGSEEMGRVLGQVVDSMGLAPVDLVLHDSAWELGANWVAENRGVIRSVMILDGVPTGTSFPIWILEIPIINQLLLGFRFMFERVLKFCCMKTVSAGEVEAHRILLKGMDGGGAVVGMRKNLNYSFDLSEWSRLDGVKDLPIQFIWSQGWSDAWINKGREIADAFPRATIITHSGGRWTEESHAAEVADSIFDFVSSLPKSAKQVLQETTPEDSELSFNEASRSSDHIHHHDHNGCMDSTYSLEHVWST